MLFVNKTIEIFLCQQFIRKILYKDFVIIKRNEIQETRCFNKFYITSRITRPRFLLNVANKVNSTFTLLLSFTVTLNVIRFNKFRWRSGNIQTIFLLSYPQNQFKLFSSPYNLTEKRNHLLPSVNQTFISHPPILPSRNLILRLSSTEQFFKNLNVILYLFYGNTW